MNICKRSSIIISNNSLIRLRKDISETDNRSSISISVNEKNIFSKINQCMEIRRTCLNLERKREEDIIFNLRRLVYTGTYFYIRHFFICSLCLLPLVQALVTKPPVLNLEKYVISYSITELRISSIRNFMEENKLKFYEVLIETNSDVRNYLAQEFKSFDTRVWYYGEQLGKFDEFKKRITSFKKAQHISFKEKHEITEEIR